MKPSLEIQLAGKNKASFARQTIDISEKSSSHAQLAFSAVSTSKDEEAHLPDPESREEKPLQRWNDPKLNMFRYFSTLYSFVVMGMNDAAVGALIPYMEKYYKVSYTVISLLFLSSFLGYIIAALLNNLIHHHCGQVAVAVLGPLGRLIGYVPMACHPPFAVLPVMLLFPGFGNGLEDSAWNAWIGNMQNANELLGFLHGAYGLGGTIAPLIATAMVTKGNLPWYTFYYLMIGMTGLEGVFAITAFWGATGRVHRESYKPAAEGGRITTRHVLREPITWTVAVFLLGYVGAEVSLGGWVVSFMLNVRGAESFAAGLTVTGFWLGLAVGRIVLGFVTGRIGEKLAITIYLMLCIVLQLLYWLVPSFVASAIFVAFLGFILGPLFPAAIVAATKLLPADYHVSAIAFAAAFGGGGAAVFPFAVGAIAQSKGVQVLQPIVLAILSFIFIVWCFLPGGLRPGGLEYARDHNEKVGHEVWSAYRWVASRFFGPKQKPIAASTTGVDP
ncbi:tRNA wybutosine-synthesizing protein [Grosmannia clavigera kw1407]|uniref:tRNA wybutosine-synthesizing protein n=1 Tax=Grosmannia clavigera (strain kw1407 / UAMH 11150) TaxID=655863 RepID=F0XTD7_GROCL|nr:tRNA wybutosine-synthesizing protein [Grosmannia clavigera kw1407]EFW98743.1 tRNA wybutosine-synthesizing protein [Grosmannia clavigera kw1407]